ncbi:MAG: PEP-CTERM sorting domain-containing protein [Hassallia sp. WJT32-NPBG1]|nr:PEP-CTERM sorting domain-containing protein [Hassallia sp. WJT32-NPBG1]
MSDAAVPEPSFTFGLIAFGALGAGLTLKRKFNIIS